MNTQTDTPNETTWRQRYEVACQTISNMQMERAHRDSFIALHNIASWLGAGGSGDGSVSADGYEKRIRKGVEAILRVEQSKLTAAHAALRKAQEALKTCQYRRIGGGGPEEFWHNVDGVAAALTIIQQTLPKETR